MVHFLFRRGVEMSTAAGRGVGRDGSSADRMATPAAHIRSQERFLPALRSTPNSLD